MLSGLSQLQMLLTLRMVVPPTAPALSEASAAAVAAVAAGGWADGRAGAAGGHGCGQKDGKGGRWMGGKSSWQAAGQVGRGGGGPREARMYLCSGFIERHVRHKKRAGGVRELWLQIMHVLEGQMKRRLQ